MSTRGNNARAFTLLEVMIGVLVIALVTVSVHRVLQTSLTGIQISSEVELERRATEGLIQYIKGQLENLPTQRQGALTGSAALIKNLPSDEMTWICQEGHGLMTSFANTSPTGEYRVTLAIQPVEKDPSRLEIGLRRRTMEGDDRVYNWLPLLRPATALEIRYFDKRLNAWIERWTDQVQRPPLVRIRVWRTPTSDPMETVIAVPAARIQSVNGNRLQQ